MPATAAAAAHTKPCAVQLRPPDADKEVPLLKPGAALICHLYPAQNKALVEKLQERKLTAISE